jgi:hypothetical protein
MNYLTIIIGLIIFELIIQLCIKKIKNNFQWFLERKDKIPKFNQIKFENYIKKSFNKNLGWIRKSNTVGYDTVGIKKIKFKINKNGYRQNIKKNKKPLVVSFGGSYVFCRQVQDKDTWQEQISKNKKFNILNYGVGNYGTDQALLYYKSTKFKKDTKIAIMGIVPEHISRIQSEWKHYSEFGNIHAFKPKFYLKNNKLILKKNSLNANTKISEIQKIINKLEKTDRFYSEKFKKNIFFFPYTYRFLTNLKFNIKIFYIYLFFKNDLPKRKDLFLKAVMKRNIIEAHNFYKEKYSTDLFFSILKEFKSTALKNKQIPVIVIFPMLLDIKNYKTNIHYKNFFKGPISRELPVLDLTKNFENKKFEKLFTNKIYGNHLTPKGNKYVSTIIYKFLKKNCNESI